MTPDEALAAAAAAAETDVPSKSKGTDLELAGLTTGALVLLAAIWSLLGHYISSRSRYLNESGTACLLGLAAGVLLLACRDTDNAGLVDELLRFNSASFFTYLLPPVIFYAGLSVEQRLFFSNLPSILSFGVLGTLVSFVLISATLYSLAGSTVGMDAQDCLALGAVFAATDSVAVLGLLDPRASPQLFSLVFGEGIVNDATSVVLLGALTRMAKQQEGYGGGEGQYSGKFDEGLGDSGAAAGDSVLVLVWRLMGNFGYLLLTSTCLGIAAGMGVAAVLRGKIASQGPHHEVALVGLLSYLAYLAAEVLGLSAILSLFCCGAAVSHFALRNGVSAAAGDDPSVHAGELSGGGPLTAAGTPHAGGHRLAESSDGATAGDRADSAVSWYETYAPILGDDSNDRGGSRSRVSGGGVLWALTAPAKRLAARAFGGGGGTCMTPAGASTTINAFRSLSYVAEGLIFIYLGMDCLDPVRWQASYATEVVWLVGLLLFLLLVARAASVVPLSMLHNLYAPRQQRLSGRDMLVIWWSGLMRGAVSVALVYLNFDTGDGSQPAADAIIAPHHTGPWPTANKGGGRLLSSAAAAGRARARLLQDPSAADMTGPGADDTATSNPDASAALAVAAALAEADALSSRQHATLIVATLLVVVASLLVVSTLTKPLLQAVLEADPRKPPLKVLSEALFDPWVDATWRLQVALGRSYRRWTGTFGGASDEGGPRDPGGPGGVASPAGARRVTSTTALAFITTHTIPMTSLGGVGPGADLGGRGQSAPTAGAMATSLKGATASAVGGSAAGDRARLRVTGTRRAGGAVVWEDELEEGDEEEAENGAGAGAGGGGRSGVQS